ncbi:MAG: AMP-binding protein, partial [bacterium]
MLLNHNGKIALVWKDEHINYEVLLRHIHYYATLFDAKQTGKVAIFSENRPEWAYAYYAAWKNNAITVPIDYMAPPDDVAYILNDCQPEVIFCSRETANILEQCKQQLTYTIQIHLFEDQQYEVSRFDPVEIDDPDLNRTAVIIYTSGTTGSPKGVMLSFDNLLANIEAVSHDIPIFNKERKVLALLPLHHIFPLMGTLVAPLYAGGTIAFSPTLNSEDIIATLQDNGINIIIGVPRLYAAIRKGIMDKINSNVLTRSLFRLAASIDSRSFSRKLFKKVHDRFGGQVDYMVSGGAKLDEAVARDFKTLGFEMLEGFGMTEAAPMITFTRPGKWRIGSAGQPMPCLEVTSKAGEIVARGRNIMQGYYNRPEETAAVLKDGWLHTGDLGYLDEENYIHITGRSKEIIVLSSGKNINPEEVEIKINGLSECIAEVGVYMKNDSLQAAIYPDFKKLKEKEILNLEDYFRWEIIDKYNQKAASYKKISKFLLLKEELPKTRLGKIQRFKLAALTDAAAGK